MTGSKTKPNRSKAIVGGLALVVLALAGGVGLYDRYYGSPRRFAVVEEGVFYRSAQPKLAQIGFLIDAIDLRTIIIARESLGEKCREEVDFAEANGIGVVHIPIRSRAPIPDEQVEDFFRVLDDPANHPVLLHCSAGRHRTGYLAALYRIERQGWTVRQALEEMRAFDPDIEPDRAVLQQLQRYRPGSLPERLTRRILQDVPKVGVTP